MQTDRKKIAITHEPVLEYKCLLLDGIGDLCGELPTNAQKLPREQTCLSHATTTNSGQKYLNFNGPEAYTKAYSLPLHKQRTKRHGTVFFADL